MPLAQRRTKKQEIKIERFALRAGQEGGTVNIKGKDTRNCLVRHQAFP
jgi:hypothetical protein